MLENLAHLVSFHLVEERRSEFPSLVLDVLSERCAHLSELELFLYNEGNQGALRTFLQLKGAQILKLTIRWKRLIVRLTD